MQDLLNNLELAEKDANQAYQEYREARARAEEVERDIIKELVRRNDFTFLKLNRTRLNLAVWRSYR